ncbi:MAG: TolB-like protein [Alphaproteobacteria bacterium]|jgi:TolB-like protein
MTILTELKRRNVFKVASVYLVTCWLILQIISVIAPALQIPALFTTITTVVLVLGFPVVCIFAWAFELTPEGLQRSNDVDAEVSVREQTGSKINYMLVGALVLAVGFISYEKLFLVSVDEDIERSIAVLPFKDMSPNKSQGYFGDGIAEEILNTLARLQKLVVISRTSSFGFKDKNTDIREIGRLLNVNFVLEGSVRKDKDQLRITAQLIEVKTGAHIWSQTYDRTLDNVFKVQDELSFAITQALKLNLLPEEVEHEAGMTDNPEAYQLFIQARELAYQRTPETLEQAATLLKQAIAIDDAFYLAKAQLYTVYFLGNKRGFTSEQNQSEKERIFGELLKSPDFPLKHLVFGLYSRDTNKPDVAKQLFEKAYRSAPNETLIQNIYLANLPDVETVIEVREKIIRTSPENMLNYNNLVYHYLLIGQLDEARQLVDTMNKTFPDSVLTLQANMHLLYTSDQDISKTLGFINSYTGKTNPDYRRYKAGMNLLAGNIDIALEYLSKELSVSPQYEGLFSEALVLLYDLSAKGKLSAEQQAKFAELPVSDGTAIGLQAFLDLIQGNALPYAEIEQWLELSPEEFSEKLMAGDITFYLYAAIKKSQGDSRYAETLPPLAGLTLKQCEQINGRSHWCILSMYIDGSYSQQQQFDAFENSLQLLNLQFIGIESFILASPTFDGVNKHPEFEQVTNEFLDNTFRTWDPDVQRPIH